MTPDIINGLFELCSAILLLLNVRILYRDKSVAGVSLVPTALFTAWGFWNIYFYSHLEQWVSFYGGIALVLVNTWWLSLAYYYTKRD